MQLQTRPVIDYLKSADVSPILTALKFIHSKYRDDFSGKVATYIPELAKVDPRLFGIALVTADGHVYQVSAAHQLFTIQSISKPFVYGFALEDNGVDYVLGKVGVEPTGEHSIRSFSTSAIIGRSIPWLMPAPSPRQR
jgi:glutaminase